MGFEAPLALLALTAVGLPILAHLLRRRDLRRQPLPTIALLQRAEASSQRRVRLVDYLLLLARILLVAALALALAGPYLRVTLAYGDGSLASVVVVLDDSMSVTGRGDGEVFAAARERARAIVEALPAGSEVAIVLAGTEARVALSRTADLAAASRTIDDLSSESARGTDLPGALERAARELAGARHADRRVVVLSDLARHGRIADAPPMPSGVELSFEPLARDAPTGNAAIVSARATPDPTTPDMLSVAVEIAASEELQGTEVTVTLERDAEVLANETLELAAPGARLSLHAPVPLEDPGATVVMEVDDAIDGDDRRGVLLRARAGAQVVIVDGDPHPLRGSDEARFVARALDLAPPDGGVIERRIVDPDTFAELDLAGTDVVILANVVAPGEAVAERLRAHVESGGGLLIAPGDHLDARAYAARLGPLLPARPTAARTAEVGGPLPADGGDLLAGARSGLEATRTRRRLGFEAVDPEARVELVFEDDLPALIRARVGEGQVALLATTVDDDWSDLPYQPGFLPLMVSLTRRLSSSASASDVPVEAGRPTTLSIPPSVTELRLVDPSGDVLERSGEALGPSVTVEDTAEPGVYRAQVATSERGLRDEPRLAFVVVPPANESDLTPDEVPEGRADGDDEAHAAGTAIRRPLARWLFLLVGLLAVAEALLRLKGRREGPIRGGGAAA